MPTNALAENILGTIGTVCWTGQLLPQIWKSWRDKSTEGLSPWLVLVWGISSSFLGAYAVVTDLNIPLIIQPQVFGALTYISWGQCQYYGARRTRLAATLMTLAAILLGAGLELLIIFTAGPAYRAGTPAGRGAIQFCGIFSSVLISLALLPQFVEIWRYKEVVGISFIFMLVDMLGGLFSDLSLAFKGKFDLFLGVTYALVVVLDAIIFIAAIILNPRAAKRRAAATRAETDVVRDSDAASVGDAYVPADLQLATVVRASMSSISLRSLTQRH
ncbi:PQ loop repeat-domain-containing protein [Roridomyces roridus]|uniref:PQ loop repeat-domain-containing protein n=1 Tax=Roridomyces roridus TaxID=1738132 RepID=A0AAD7FHS4_9AGAR|nr:PQ loop repeat-domain-containing protein [Roridomyces roridus]